MKKVVLVMLAAVGLTGCEATNPGARLVNLLVTDTLQTPSERIASESAADDASCRQYGASPGTDAYTNCRVQMAQMRQQRKIAASQAQAAQMQELQGQMAASQAALAAQMAAMAPPAPQHCTTTYFGSQAQTNCN